MKRKSFRIVLVLFILQLVFIWGNSLLSREDSGGMSFGITAFLQRLFDPDGRLDPEVFHHYIRKAAHFTEFGLLGALAFLLRRFREDTAEQVREISFFAPFCVLLAAVVDEYIQFFADRGSMVPDVVLDFCGGVFGIACTALIVAVLRDKTRSK